MRADQIQVGKTYARTGATGRRIIRTVTEEGDGPAGALRFRFFGLSDHDAVRYQSSELPDGETEVCTRRAFARWAQEEVKG